MARRVRAASQKVSDFKASLKVSEHPNLDRKVGVLVGEPFDHVGLKKRMVEVWCEYPTVNTNETAKMVSADQVTVASQTVESLLRCRDKCAKIMYEMNEHCKRLDEVIERVSHYGLD